VEVATLPPYNIPVHALVYEGRVKNVFFGWVASDNRGVAFILEAARQPYDEVDIPYVVIQQAVDVVETLQFDTPVTEVVSIAQPDPRDTWERYLADDFGIRYPDSWTLTETDGGITLQQDDVTLRLASDAELPDGEVVFADTVMLGSESFERQVIARSGDPVALTLTSSEWMIIAESETSLTTKTLIEIDAILATLKG
jgi:hypothetical protein